MFCSALQLEEPWCLEADVSTQDLAPYMGATTETNGQNKVWVTRKGLFRELDSRGGLMKREGLRKAIHKVVYNLLALSSAVHVQHTKAFEKRTKDRPPPKSQAGHQVAHIWYNLKGTMKTNKTDIKTTPRKAGWNFLSKPKWVNSLLKQK